MKRYLYLICLLFSLALSGVAKKPNVICILVDDLGYSDLSSFGGTDIRTPAIDGLMKAGLRMDQFYANCTVCTPTRASLLTGRYPDMVGAPGVIRQWEKDSWGYFNPSGPTMPDLMSKAGYHTGMVGKWHLGFKSPNVPNDRGFDFFHGFLADMMDDYWTHLRGGVNWMRRNKEEVKPKGHATEVFTRWGIDYVKEQVADKKKPFFLYLAYNAPHFPIQPPKDWLEKVQKREPRLDKKRATNVAFVEHMDHEIGKFLDAVKELGIAEDTLIVFSSDNGGSLPHGALNGKLRGGKQDHWEGGIRVPLMIRGPSIEAGAVCRVPVAGYDFLPTFHELVGGKGKLSDELDGGSFVALFSDPKTDSVKRPIDGLVFSRPRQGMAVIRTGQWKLLAEVNANREIQSAKLFNVVADIAEEHDLSTTQAHKAKKLQARLKTYLQTVVDPSPTMRRRKNVD